MICRDARELLSALIDEQLTEAEELSVRAHLEGCAECRSLAAELESAVAAVRALPRVEATPDFTARVMTRVRRHEERRARWRDLAFWEPGALLPVPALRVAAAVVLGLLVGYGAAQWVSFGAKGAPLQAHLYAAPPESLGTGPQATGLSHGPVDLDATSTAAGDVDYVLDRYTVVGGGAESPAVGPSLVNQDVPVRF
jgi:hypothetical protein